VTSGEKGETEKEGKRKREIEREKKREKEKEEHSRERSADRVSRRGEPRSAARRDAFSGLPASNGNVALDFGVHPWRCRVYYALLFLEIRVKRDTSVSLFRTCAEETDRLRIREEKAGATGSMFPSEES